MPADVLEGQRFVIGRFSEEHLPADVLERARELLGAAIDQVGGADVDELLEGELWLVFDEADLDNLVAVLSIAVEHWRESDGRGRSALTVCAVGGESFWDWSATVQRALEARARELGADTIRALARPGMAKWLKRLGYDELAQIMELRVHVR